MTLKLKIVAFLPTRQATQSAGIFQYLTARGKTRQLIVSCRVPPANQRLHLTRSSPRLPSGVLAGAPGRSLSVGRLGAPVEQVVGSGAAEPSHHPTDHANSSATPSGDPPDVRRVRRSVAPARQRAEPVSRPRPRTGGQLPEPDARRAPPALGLVAWLLRLRVHHGRRFRGSVARAQCSRSRQRR